MLRSLRRTALKTATAAGITLTAVEITTHLPSQGRSSQFYHDVSDRVVMPLIRFGLDPETAHNLAVEAANRGWGPRSRPYGGGDEWRIEMGSEPFVSASSSPPRRPPESSSSSQRQLQRKRLVFPNPIGLAAGFDKDGVAVPGLMELGFGFIEVGSVTPDPQPGNPKPRMFRLTEDRAVINSYGFNSAGADEVETNLRHFREQASGNAPSDSGDIGVDSGKGGRMVGLKKIREDIEEARQGEEESVGAVLMRHLWDRTKRLVATPSPPPKSLGLLGVNLGKNKTSADEIADYSRGIRQLGPLADYLVVNISSPNTPGLRGLQRREPLRRLLGAALRERDGLPSRGADGAIRYVPLLVKIAPDLTEDEMVDIAAVVRECGVDGMVVSNTSTSRPTTLLSRHKREAGGLSGAPIRDVSTECIRTMYKLTDGTVPIIGVGGVGSGRDAYDKLKAGASLVQVYSMMVYEGPGVVSRIRSELAELMVQNGQRKVQDVVGLDHEDIYWRKREERTKTERLQEKVYVEE